MKIIITIILALFIASQAYSEDRYKSLKDVCGNYEHRIILFTNRAFKDGMEQNLEAVAKHEEQLQKYAKLYHYLDCREVLKYNP